MFSFTDHDADDTLLSAPREGLDAEIAYTNSVRDVLRLSRQAEARAVIGAYTIGRQAHHDRITSSPHLTSRSQATAHKHAIGEISLQLGVTRTKAGQWSSLGEMLHDLPKIRLAYLAGDFSTHRVTELVTSAQIAPKGDLRQRIDAIIDASLTPHPTPDNSDPTADDDNTTDTDTDTEDAHADTDDADVNAEADTDADAEDEARAPIDFEDIALELAYRPTTDTVLRDELDNTLITLDPDAHAAAREDVAQAFQNVTFAKEAFGHTNLSACLSAEHAVHLQQRIATLLDQRVCRRDPRRIGHRRADALAEIHGVPGAHLHCECGYDTCTARTTSSSSTVSDPDTTPYTKIPPTLATTLTETDCAETDCAESHTAPTEAISTETDSAESDIAESDVAASDSAEVASAVSPEAAATDTADSDTTAPDSDCSDSPDSDPSDDKPDRYRAECRGPDPIVSPHEPATDIPSAGEHRCLRPTPVAVDTTHRAQRRSATTTTDADIPGRITSPDTRIIDIITHRPPTLPTPDHPTRQQHPPLPRLPLPTPLAPLPPPRGRGASKNAPQPTSPAGNQRLPSAVRKPRTPQRDSTDPAPQQKVRSEAAVRRRRQKA